MLTPYQKRQKDEDFTDQMVPIEKNRKKKELIFKTNALVPKKSVIRKEEGATVEFIGHFVSLPSLSWLSHRPDRQRSSMELSKPSGKPH